MIELRDYQRTFVDQIRTALETSNRVVGVSPTGSGKRYMACWMAARSLERGRKVGVVTDRRILVTQMASECRQHGIDYGLRMADSPRNDDAPVQICSLQTLKIRRFQDLPPADLWIIDEAHKTTHSYMQLLSCYPEAKVVSLTATPVGRNGCSLVGQLGPLVEPYRNTELIAQGWLLPTLVYAPSEPDLRGVSVNYQTGEFSERAVGQRVEECFVFADVFRWWRPYAGRQTIAFVPRLKFARWLAEQFNRRGHPASVVEGKTPQYERKELFRRFEDREIRVLVNVGVLIEGFDMPIASVGLDITPNRQFRSFWQKVGRVRRPHEDQQQAVWLDFSGNIWRFTHPDENPEWPTGEETIAELIHRKKELEPKEPWSCAECGYVLAFWERLTGGVCPRCGLPVKKAMRRIRMAGGQMRQVPLGRQRQVRRSWQQQEWDRARYQVHHLQRPLFVAAKIYTKRVGAAPDSSLRPPPPPPGSPLWRKKPCEVWPGIGRSS